MGGWVGECGMGGRGVLDYKELHRRVFPCGQFITVTSLHVHVRCCETKESGKVLGNGGMAEGVDTIACCSFTTEKQPQAMSELLYH